MEGVKEGKRGRNKMKKTDGEREKGIKIKRTHPEACSVIQNAFTLMELPHFKSHQNQC